MFYFSNSIDIFILKYSLIYFIIIKAIETQSFKIKNYKMKNFNTIISPNISPFTGKIILIL